LLANGSEASAGSVEQAGKENAMTSAMYITLADIFDTAAKDIKFASSLARRGRFVFAQATTWRIFETLQGRVKVHNLSDQGIDDFESQSSPRVQGQRSEVERRC